MRVLLGFVLLCGVANGAEPLGKGEPAGRVAYGDTAEFWESHALVVATVERVENRDELPERVVSDVTLSVTESVPARHAPGTRFTMTFVFNLRIGPVRDKPEAATHLQRGDRVMLVVTERKGRIVPQLATVIMRPMVQVPDAEGAEYTAFAMLPDWKLERPKQDDAVVVETVRVCRALSERDAGKRLKLIETILKDKPDDRVRDLMRRSLQATLERAQRDAEEARRLLDTAGKK